MKFPRPRSLNGLILVGFGLVALPLLVAVLWALFNLDRLATQSEELVFTGVAAAENNGLLVEQVASPERVARQHQNGRLTVRERMEAFLDPGSFHETGALAGKAPYDEL